MPTTNNRKYRIPASGSSPDLAAHLTALGQDVDQDVAALAVQVTDLDQAAAQDADALAALDALLGSTATALRKEDAAVLEAAKTHTNASKWSRGSLVSSTDYRELGEGVHLVATSAAASAMGLPFGAAGNLHVSPGGNYGRTVIFETFGAGSRPNQSWRTTRNASGVWTAWTQTNAAIPLKYALTASAVLDDLEPGYYWVGSYDTARQIKGLEHAPAAGDYIVYPGLHPIHEWKTAGLSSRPNEIWQRERRPDGTWTKPWRTDARAIAPAPLVPAASGFKVIPLAVTLDGNGGASATSRTAREERLPMVWYAPITRFRVHIANQNTRTNERNPGALSSGGLFLGVHGGGGDHASAPRQISGPFTTPADGAEWVSPWINMALDPGTEYLLNFGFTAGDGTRFFYHNGQSYASDIPTNAGKIKHGAAGTAKALLDVWIEAETYATTPVIATIGSSSSVGVGANFPAQENTASLVAKRVGALPMHYGGAGDTMATAANFDWSRWTRWSHLARPDAVLNFMGSNDVFEDGATLETLKARHLALSSYLSAQVSANLYLATVTPRSTVTGAQETLRRQFNSWLRSLPDTARDIFDFAATVSTDDETVSPAYDSGDGYHFNTAGHQALAAAVNRPITSPPVAYVAQGAS